MAKDSRHLARLLAAQYFFTILKNQQTLIGTDVFEPTALLKIIEEKKFDRNLYENIIDGVTEKLDQIDAIITEMAPAWPIDRIDPTDLVVLRIGIWESTFYDATPKKVAINEAIELAKSINGIESGSFINGVLGNLLKKNEKNRSK